MTWIADNLQILATLGSALGVYTFIRWSTRKDLERLEKRFDKLESRMDRIELRMDRLESKIDDVKDRVSRIEGQLIGPPHWEPKIKGE